MGDKAMKQIFIFSDSQKDNISYFEREPAMLVFMNRSDLPYLKEQDFASMKAGAVFAQFMFDLCL